MARPLTRRIPAAALAALLVLLLPRPAPAQPLPTLADFWPLDAPPRQWTLIEAKGRNAPHPLTRLILGNETLAPGSFILWFSGRVSQPADKRTGEQYRLCRTPARTWLFLDRYIDTTPKPARHDVLSDRIRFTPSGAPPEDLIADGLYGACGATGQPYLLWSDLPPTYRIQVWGHMAANPQRLWYWDATVTAPRPVINPCRDPATPTAAVKVEESWWSNFNARSGAWDLGSGEIDRQTGTPTGTDITYGRTVWHGAGQIPYLMTAGPDKPPGSGWCVKDIEPTSAN
jgi:hypothetical protein